MGKRDVTKFQDWLKKLYVGATKLDAISINKMAVEWYKSGRAGNTLTFMLNSLCMALVGMICSVEIYVEARKPSADGILQFFSRFIPRKNREEIVGDLREDLAEFRQEGLGERRLILHVLWQLFYCVAPRLAKWGTFGWLAEAVRKYLAK